MPQYLYECPKCGSRLETFRSVANYKNYPEHCGSSMRQVITRPNIIMDIQPYKTVACDKETGKHEVITSRRQHKNFLARNGYEELGNDGFKPLHPEEIHEIQRAEKAKKQENDLNVANSVNWDINS